MASEERCSPSPTCRRASRNALNGIARGLERRPGKVSAYPDMEGLNVGSPAVGIIPAAAVVPALEARGASRLPLHLPIPREAALPVPVDTEPVVDDAAVGCGAAIGSFPLAVSHPFFQRRVGGELPCARGVCPAGVVDGPGGRRFPRSACSGPGWCRGDHIRAAAQQAPEGERNRGGASRPVSRPARLKRQCRSSRR